MGRRRMYKTLPPLLPVESAGPPKVTTKSDHQNAPDASTREPCVFYLGCQARSAVG